MSLFRRRKPAGPAAPEQPKSGDGGEETAAIIAAICSMGGTAPSSLVVRKITRVADQGTNWNRLVLDKE